MKPRAGMIGIALPLLLAGCFDTQSVLAPAGPEADRIFYLAGVLFIGAIIVMLVVMAALWLSIRGSHKTRRTLAGDNAVVVGGVIFPVVTLTALLAYGVWVMRANISHTSTSDPVRIDVVGEQWWWRIAYLDAQGNRIAGANEIRIPIGREVEFTLRSADVIHSFWVPSLGGKVDMIPGRSNALRLVAERPGIYRGQCAEYCGGPHALMALEVVAVPNDEFIAWLSVAAQPAQEPARDAERRGRELFLAAGCGSCHAIRGTLADGVIGPDLTRLGERRFIAAATLPMTPANIARFITDGQHIKPDNGMPPFRIFTADELAAVSGYLAGLK